MSGRLELRLTPDPWHGRQPRYEKLVMAAPDRFALVTRLPSGERVTVGLGRLPAPPPSRN